MEKLNLRMFALASSTFEDGDVAIGANAVEVSFKFGESTEYVVACLNTANENPNTQTETWYDLCGGGVSSSAIVGYDTEFSFEATLRKGSISADIILARYSETLNRVPMRLDNTLIDERLETEVMINVGEITYVANELIKVSFFGIVFKRFTIGSEL
jgi:hypothetical protein